MNQTDNQNTTQKNTTAKSANTENSPPRRTPSQAQVDANRRNAQKSSGPRTAAGKLTSSRNRLLHGLRANTHILVNEDPQQFTSLLDDLFDRFQPVGDSEETIVLRIAAGQWRLDRVFSIEAGLHREGIRKIDNGDLRDKPEYLQHKKNYANYPDRVPPPPILADEDDRIARAFAADAAGPNSFTQLARYEASIERSLDRNLHQLKFFQDARKAAHPAATTTAAPAEPPSERPPSLRRESGFEEEIGQGSAPSKTAPPPATASNQENCHSNPTRGSARLAVAILAFCIALLVAKASSTVLSALPSHSRTPGYVKYEVMKVTQDPPKHARTR